MADANSTEAKPIEVECPKCKHTFFHKLGHAIKHGAEKVAEGVGTAIGEAKFGGN